MIFVLSYSFPPENRQACRERFKETGGKPPEDIKLLGQWVAISDAKGVAVFESDDPMVMAKWAQQWSDIMTMDIYPAITNEALGQLF